MNNRLAVIGSSDLGQLIAYHAKQSCNYEVVGYYDDFNPNVINSDGLPILGKLENILSDFEIKKFHFLIVAIGYKHMKFRREVFMKFKDTIPFASVIHPTANIDSSCFIGKGCFILPGCVLDRNVKINDNVVLNTACIVAHDSEVGAHSFLSPAIKMAGFSKIQECCIIGINATIIDNVVISDEIQIGAGAIVIKSLMEKGLYIGCPAHKIK
jgi:sugar O-acyltransferase (sialic acid O-acetyltransferase NeuD family)